MVLYVVNAGLGWFVAGELCVGDLMPACRTWTGSIYVRERQSSKARMCQVGSTEAIELHIPFCLVNEVEKRFQGEMPCHTWRGLKTWATDPYHDL